MTVTDFDDRCTDWWELKDFCNEYDCCVLDDVYSDDQVDDYINERLWDKVRAEAWTDVRDWLSSFDEYYGEGFYRINDYEEIIFLDEEYDFPRYKDEVRRWAIEENIFEDEDEDDDCEADLEDGTTESPFEAAEFSLDELYEQSSVVLNTIQKERSDVSSTTNYNELWT